MIPWLEKDTPFPDVSEALTEAEGAPGLLAAGADLSPARLLNAYQNGIFPWFSERQPVLWWSTDPRMVLPTAEFKISESLRKTLKKVDQSMRTGGRWQVRFDTAFESVIRACAAPRERASGTWISEEIVAGYCQLHAMGYAHSSELWLDNELVGGAYGICIGRMFYGESMFAKVTDASKTALAYLVEFLRAQNVELIDCQQETNHLASLGGRTVPRAAFISHMKSAIAQPTIAHWVPRLMFSEPT
jgi:leucyl/phenylalanyl-tRNA--protein transferase